MFLVDNDYWRHAGAATEEHLTSGAESFDTWGSIPKLNWIFRAVQVSGRRPRATAEGEHGAPIEIPTRVRRPKVHAIGTISVKPDRTS